MSLQVLLGTAISSLLHSRWTSLYPKQRGPRLDRGPPRTLLCDVCSTASDARPDLVGVLVRSSSFLFFTSIPLYILTSCLSQCTASSAPQSASSPSCVVAKMSSSFPSACSSNHPRHAARCALSASSCTSKYASPSGCVTP